MDRSITNGQFLWLSPVSKQEFGLIDGETIEEDEGWSSIWLDDNVIGFQILEKRCASFPIVSS